MDLGIGIVVPYTLTNSVWVVHLSAIRTTSLRRCFLPPKPETHSKLAFGDISMKLSIVVPYTLTNNVWVVHPSAMEVYSTPKTRITF